MDRRDRKPVHPALRRLLLLLAVVAASLLVADARPCHTFLVAFPVDPNPNPSRGDGAVHHHLGIPHVATVITVFRVRRLGPQVPHGHRNHHHHHLHSIPANVQIHRPDLPHLAAGAAAAAGPQERARGILVVVVGLLFGIACGALSIARRAREVGGQRSTGREESGGSRCLEPLCVSPKPRRCYGAASTVF
ncbi:uncharacterized protein LOC8076302 [Sorghum bicolor]|uniref:uncharacterized protein LOC8076302 n=1 Tax=Sorghum bicolor TaxID=4558 RepID=UPI000B4241E3|nr:uncharacterized protein LOC8076302 [Sorghum bicolor]|eukprot:XP_002442916.2 uncharacterized protein LOC8076302 [Sorghum bicolor]